MSRIVVVSNRIPNVRMSGRSDEVEIPAGGLASAVFSALSGTRGNIWFGWSGKQEPAERLRQTSRQRVAGVDIVGAPLTHREATDYYQGFCNGVLWPLFHCFQGRVRMDLRHEAAYRGVQARFAAMLLPLLRSGDCVWVHDYHLLLLGRELRRLGWTGRIGFFLHVPFPAYDLWQLLPDPRGFLQALLDYDLVGFQVGRHLDNYVYCCRRLLGARWTPGQISVGGRVQAAAAYPIGIEPDEFRPPEVADRPSTGRGILGRVVRGRRLILGVDRLDYTKGVPERFLAYEDFLERYPEWRKKVSYIQIGSPTRTGAAHYLELKRTVEALVGRINGEMAEHDWVPLRYLYRSYPRQVLGKFYREAFVGLVTPLRDGMNLVAKEFVAAQYPASPGVLVLSRTAGAAEDLPEAVMVNPYVLEEVADGIAGALGMPLGERVERYKALMTRIVRGTAGIWFRRFVQDLEATGPAAGVVPGLLPRRTRETRTFPS